MGQQYSHLSSEERILIEKLHCEQHLSIRRTAERIGRDKSTVSRELRRGLWFASNENGSYRPYRPKRLKTGPWTSGPFYSALAAQRKADLRRRGSRKPRRMDSGPLRAWVLDSLRRGWSPELIEGRLKAQYAGDPSMRISHECLYQWIYAKPQRALDLRQYLARGRKRRTRKKGRKAKGPRIPMRVPITDRPEAVGSRKGFGHFESDTVVGAAPSRRCMNTQVERRSRRLFARLVDDKSASATARAEYEIFKGMPFAALWSAVFFILLTLASLTSTISFHEVLTAYFAEEHKLSRKNATRLTSALSAALCALTLAFTFDISIGSWLHLEDISFFEIFDYTTANILMPLGGLFTCIFAAWYMKPSFLRGEMTNYGELRGRAFPLLRFTLRYITPLLLIYIFVCNLGLL